jgi:uncharacterized protein (DUF1697 family)
VTFIVLLRGINVGGKNRMGMAELEGLAGAAGLASPRTWLQSGNLAGDCGHGDAGRLAGDLGRAIRQELGLEVAVLVRTAAEWRELVAANPLAGAAGVDAEFLHVSLLDSPPDDPAGLERRLEAARGGNERFALCGSALYLYCPDGYGRTRLNNTSVERWSDRCATTRNWRTVLALAGLAGPGGAASDLQ